MSNYDRGLMLADVARRGPFADKKAVLTAIENSLLGPSQPPTPLKRQLDGEAFGFYIEMGTSGFYLLVDDGPNGYVVRR